MFLLRRQQAICGKCPQFMACWQLLNSPRKQNYPVNKRYCRQDSSTTEQDLDATPSLPLLQRDLNAGPQCSSKNSAVVGHLTSRHACSHLCVRALFQQSQKQDGNMSADAMHSDLFEAVQCQNRNRQYSSTSFYRLCDLDKFDGLQLQNSCQTAYA